MRRWLAGRITRVTYWLDIIVAPRAAEYVHRFAARVDDFVERHVWSIDEIVIVPPEEAARCVRGLVERGDTIESSFMFSTDTSRWPSAPDIDKSVPGWWMPKPRPDEFVPTPKMVREAIDDALREIHSQPRVMLPGEEG